MGRCYIIDGAGPNVSGVRHLTERILLFKDKTLSIRMMFHGIFTASAFVFYPVSSFRKTKSYSSFLVEITGLEPVAFCLQGRRSCQLNYIPMVPDFL